MQADHDRLVAEAAHVLTGKQFRNLKADIPGYPVPEPITRTPTRPDQIPDVTAHGTRFTIFEVETADSIDDPHTTDQWTLFATYADRQGADFLVVVPKGSARAAGGRLAELKIHAKVWEL